MAEVTVYQRVDGSYVSRASDLSPQDLAALGVSLPSEVKPTVLVVADPEPEAPAVDPEVAAAKAAEEALAAAQAHAAGFDPAGQPTGEPAPGVQA